jgi:hypothetical protein
MTTENQLTAAALLYEACREFVRVMEDPRTTLAMPHTVKKAKQAIRAYEALEASEKRGAYGSL